MNETAAFLLVAPPGSLRELVVLVAVHAEEGSLGFVINRRSYQKFTEAVVHVGVDPLDQTFDHDVTIGGSTLSDAGWLLFDLPEAQLPDDSCELSHSIHITASPDAIVEVLARSQQKGRRARILLSRGHMSWGPGELEQELAGGTWLRSPATFSMVFETPLEQRWSEAVCSALGLSRPWLSGDLLASA